MPPPLWKPRTSSSLIVPPNNSLNLCVFAIVWSNLSSYSFLWKTESIVFPVAFLELSSCWVPALQSAPYSLNTLDLMTSQGSRDHCYNTVVGVWSLSPIHPPLNGSQKVATIFLSELIAGPEGPLHTQQRMYIFCPIYRHSNWHNCLECIYAN